MGMNKDVGSAAAIELGRKINDVGLVNAGYSGVTAIQNYAREGTSSQVYRNEDYSITWHIMKNINRIMELEGFGVQPPIVEKRCLDLIIGFHELKKNYKEMFPGMEFRKNQGKILASMGVASHNFCVQAPTGFGKTVLLATILKAFNKKNKDLINLVLLPYNPLKTDMV